MGMGMKVRHIVISSITSFYVDRAYIDWDVQIIMYITVK